MPYHSPISNRSPEPKSRQLLTLIGLFISIIIIIIFSSFLLINQLINLIPVDLERQLGRAITSKLVVDKTESVTTDKLNQLVDNLETEISNEDTAAKRDYQVFYIKEDTINALAIPGDRIIIYQGLLDKIDSENELVMVLGHEIGHFANRDHLKRLGNFVVIKLLLSFLFSPDTILYPGADLTNLIINAQYSQKQEIEADKFGIKLLNKHYGHVAGATDFFDKLQTIKKSQNNTNIDFLSSHPLPKNRIKKLNKLIDKENYILGEKTRCSYCS